MKNRLFQGEYVSSDRLLYTPSEFAKSNLFYLQEIGNLKAQKTHTSKRQNLSSFLFFYVKSGSGFLDYQGREYEIKQGDCVFIDCHNPYSHRTSENLWSLEWIHFNGNVVLPIYLKYIERGGQPVFHPDNPDELQKIFDKLGSIAHSADYIRDIRINEVLSSLLTFIMSFSWNPDIIPTDSNAKIFFGLREYLDSHYPEKITLDNLADKFLINKYALSRGFKEQFGTSIINYLLSVRITHAKQLLRFTSDSIEEIGNQCGITPLYYFSRIFKQIEGISPMEYRLQWK
ncbi:MAG: AraC family transcriptional regulator [Butyrivibrio sp.]|uniref:AraC family transcriptional regulator n=1 Tax=Butyrivibrio sp. TaxID=28121 RepID=UPI001AFD2EB3|nr:AraC family transcriptional regulator [Butyrivibrio sp.]MBO6241591.1 AraC family transcriptional regulator [Butyrivibrio sp.]